MPHTTFEGKGWRLRLVAEQASTLSRHPHKLPRCKLNSLQITRADGTVVYTFDGSGSYYCRFCTQLQYGAAHHCQECYPSFDVCGRCFEAQKLLDLGRDAHSGALSLAPAAAPPTPPTPDAPLDPFRQTKPAQPTCLTLLADAKAHEFSHLLDILFPRLSQEDLAAEVQGLQASKVDYAFRDEKTGRTVLHFAAEAGADKVVLGLLMHVTEEVKNGQDHRGLTALMIGAMLGEYSVVEELLYGGADTSVKCLKGYTALMLAVCYDRPDVTSRIVFGGADVNETSPITGRSALAIAALNGNVQCVRRLLASDSTDTTLSDHEGYSPIVLAAAKGHQDIVAVFPQSDRDTLKW